MYNMLRVGNAGWLGLVQVLNYGIPILTLPVVTRALGPSIFGIVATITAYTGYVGLLINYGFNFTGPRRVSPLRDPIPTLSGFISAILFGQLMLTVIACAAFLIVLHFVQIDSTYRRTHCSFMERRQNS
jgi:PST family polysaccharide transporter